LLSAFFGTAQVVPSVPNGDTLYKSSVINNEATGVGPLFNGDGGGIHNYRAPRIFRGALTTGIVARRFRKDEAADEIQDVFQ
jgi:hypothetical protein